MREIPVDPTLLKASDHNWSTFYQHQGFLELVRSQDKVVSVTFDDGKTAVLMGMAAQISMREHRTVSLSELQ